MPTTSKSMPVSSTQKIINFLENEDKSSTKETEHVLNPEINEDRSTKPRVTTGNGAEDGQATKIELDSFLGKFGVYFWNVMNSLIRRVPTLYSV